MLTSLILATALMTQSPNYSLLKDKPAPKPAVAAQTKQTQQEAIASTIRRKNEAKARKKTQRYNKALMDFIKAQAAQREAERLAPIIAAQEAHQSQMMFQQAATQATIQLGNAAQKNAEINRRRYILQSQEAGQPQIFDRSQGGFVPYGGGAAIPR